MFGTEGHTQKSRSVIDYNGLNISRDGFKEGQGTLDVPQELANL